MEISTELKFILGGVLFFALLALFHIFLLKLILPRIVKLFETFLGSYKHCIKSIESSGKIKELLGEVMKIQSLPTTYYPVGFVSFAKYRFRLHGSSRNAILKITLHWGRESDQYVWVFDRADLEVDGEITDIRSSQISIE